MKIDLQAQIMDSWRQKQLDLIQRMKQAEQLPPPISHACGCIGPQHGQPLCPCQMRSVQIKDGRYVRIQDLGPAAP